MHAVTIAHVIPAFAPVAHARESVAITGNGPLAQRFNSEGHGLITVSGYTVARVERNPFTNARAKLHGGDFSYAYRPEY